MCLGPDRTFHYFLITSKKYKVENFKIIWHMHAKDNTSWEYHQAGDEKKI